MGRRKKTEQEWRFKYLNLCVVVRVHNPNTCDMEAGKHQPMATLLSSYQNKEKKNHREGQHHSTELDIRVRRTENLRKYNKIYEFMLSSKLFSVAQAVYLSSCQREKRGKRGTEINK